MAVKFVKDEAQLGATIGTIYTVPANTTALIEAVTATNVTAGSLTIDVHLVDSGGSAIAANKYIDADTVTANTDVVLDSLVGHVLEAGATVQALCSAATSVNLRVSARELT